MQIIKARPAGIPFLQKIAFYIKLKVSDVIDRNGDPMVNIKDVLNVETVIRNGEIFKIQDLLKK